MLTKATGTVIKIEGQKAMIQHIEDFNKQLSLLDSGIYQVIVCKMPDKLKSMKRYYFTMESELARHLGYKKTELHEILKEYIGQTICINTGKAIYQSVAEIDEENEMMVRIIELQEYAATVHDYVFQDKTEQFK